MGDLGNIEAKKDGTATYPVLFFSISTFTLTDTNVRIPTFHSLAPTQSLGGPWFCMRKKMIWGVVAMMNPKRLGRFRRMHLATYY